MEARTLENWHLPLVGVYCAVGDGRVVPGSLIEQMYQMRWVGLRLLTNPARATLLARRRPHDLVYVLSEDGQCIRAEHLDLEPTSLQSIIRRWSGRGIDVLWGSSHGDVERVLAACRKQHLPTHVAVQRSGDVVTEDVFSKRFDTLYGTSKFVDDNGIIQYRIRSSHLAGEASNRLASSAAEEPPLLGRYTTDQTSSAYLAHWAKHDKLRRLEQYRVTRRKIMDRMGLKL